jgi:hypothetical protein
VAAGVASSAAGAASRVTGLESTTAGFASAAAGLESAAGLGCVVTAGAATDGGTSSPPLETGAACGAAFAGLALTLGTSSPPTKSAGCEAAEVLFFRAGAGLGTSSPSIAVSAVATVCEAARRISARADAARGVAVGPDEASIFGPRSTTAASEPSFAQAAPPPEQETTTATTIASRSIRTPSIGRLPSRTKMIMTEAQY